MSPIYHLLFPSACLFFTFALEYLSKSEMIGSLKVGNVWVFVQLIHRHKRTTHHLYKNPNIAELEISYQLWSLLKGEKDRH